jgi:hypothetical protein
MTMSHSEQENPAGTHVNRRMLHDLMNHLTVALGHSDLLLMDMTSEASLRPAIAEIRSACGRAVDMAEGWRACLPPEA